MKIGELIRNPDFDFNPEFRLLLCRGIAENGKVELVVIGNDKAIPRWVLNCEISAINQTAGIIDIETVDGEENLIGNEPIIYD